MNTTQIVTLFRNYTDEPDESFLSNPDAALYCKMGYDQFRNHISEINPYAIAQTVNITLANARTYDLTQGNVIATAVGTPSVLGPNPNNNTVPIGRMNRLLAVYSIDANGNVAQTYQVVNTQTALRLNVRTVQLRGTNLEFATVVNGTIQLVYSSEQIIGRTNPVVANEEPTWVTAATGAIPTVNIDDNMQIWHDMIPLFAVEQYDIQNGMVNEQAALRMQRRKVELRDYLAQRDYAGVHYVVHDVDPNSEWGTGIF